MTQAVLGLGSNRNFNGLTPVELLAKACAALTDILHEPVFSCVYRTGAMYVTDQDDFYNMAVLGTFEGNEQAISATFIDLPFKHNGSKLEYDESTQRYMYSEYGQAHVDPGNNNEQLGFTNVLLQDARYVKFDDNGYMMFYSIDYNRDGWYITEGKAIPITWSKEAETSPTRYFDKDGNEIVLNTGKTYIALIPDDKWSGLSLK